MPQCLRLFIIATLEIKNRAILHHTNGDNPYQSQIVTEHDLVACIAEGWEIVRRSVGTVTS
jgi:hypothetical protein